jgi:hypothetical protein
MQLITKTRVNKAHTITVFGFVHLGLSLGKSVAFLKDQEMFLAVKGIFALWYASQHNVTWLLAVFIGKD